MDREKLIIALMKEYELSREDAEARADKIVASTASMYPTQEADPDAEGDEDEEIYWDVSEVLCVKCLTRWIAVRPSDVMLKDIDCPTCKYKGAVIETGQEFYMDEEDLEGLGEDPEEE